MSVSSPEIIQLRSDVEKLLGQSLHSPADFQWLIQQIWNKQHTILSLSTIKRLWGYVPSNGVPRLSTLNTLSQFLGYADWNAYLVALEQRGGNESAMFQGEGISVSALQPNDRIEVCWQPNRRCIFCYLGKNQFVVEESINAKLHTGDLFNAATFIVGHPMYIDNLLCSDGSRSSYVAGKRHGLTSVNLIKNQSISMNAAGC